MRAGVQDILAVPRYGEEEQSQGTIRMATEWGAVQEATNEGGSAVSTVRETREI